MRTTIILAEAMLALVLLSTPAAAITMFGSLSNFDVINDTNDICRGFEIELEGVSPADIAFMFGSPYIRYGDPVKIDTGTGTIVRYASAFGPGGWEVGTPIQDPLNPVTTGGHQLFYGGDPNYINEPGDHFGVALNGNPTNTIYRWLHGDALGNLVGTGSNVKVPAPVWNVQPPVVNPAAPAAIQAVVPALPKEPGEVFGEPIWVKVFVMESPEPADLEHLLVGDPAVPDGDEAVEVEIEWQLLQAGKDLMDEVDSGLNDLAEDSQSITRRYEFYEYTGPRDPENGEALLEDPGPELNGVGNFLGGQNAALDLDGFVVAEPGTLTLLAIGLAGMAGYCWRRRRAEFA